MTAVRDVGGVLFRGVVTARAGAEDRAAPIEPGGTDPALSLHRHGAKPDPLGLRRFRSAATRLAVAISEEEREAAGHDAAAALVSLAAAHRAEELRSALVPDPSLADATWTVCCYEVGDIAPSGLHDFVDPVAAVAGLVACPEPNHVAAELIASTPTGLRWTALVRTNERARFQLPDASTVRGGDAEIEASLKAWEQRLSQWVSPEPSPAPITPPSASPASPPLAIGEPSSLVAVDLTALVGALAPRREDSTSPVDPDSLGTVQRALAMLDDRTAGDRRDLDLITRALETALATLRGDVDELGRQADRSALAVDRLTTRLDTTKVSLDRRIDAEVAALDQRVAARVEALATKTSEVTDSLAAGLARQAAATARFEDDMRWRLESVERMLADSDARHGARVDRLAAEGADRFEKIERRQHQSARDHERVVETVRADVERQIQDVASAVAAAQDRATAALAVARDESGQAAAELLARVDHAQQAAIAEERGLARRLEELEARLRQQAAGLADLEQRTPYRATRQWVHEVVVARVSSTFGAVLAAGRMAAWRG